MHECGCNVQVRDSAAAGAVLSSSLNHVPAEGLGLLHLLAALGQDWAVSAAGHAGADLDVRDAWGRTPLHWAAARGHEVCRCRPLIMSLHTDFKAC